VIEAAIGGSGNDSFYGNNANNSFLGGVGNDSFYDSLGSDIYSEEAGIDWLYFTESIELLRYELTSDSLLFSRSTGSLDVDQVWNSIDYLVFNSSTFSYNDLVRSLSGPLLPNVTITAVNGLASGAATNSTTLSPDEVVVAVQNPITLSGIAFDDSDLARLSRNTSGGFSVSMFFDGSDVGLTTNAEAIDAVTGLADGSWLISTRGSGSVPGVASFAAEDILRFRPTSLGANTAGSWSLQADMSDVGISGTAENVTALSTAADGRLFLTTSGSFVSPLAFDGSLYGLGANALLGIHVPV
jgi:hypothetical protein